MKKIVCSAVSAAAVAVGVTAVPAQAEQVQIPQRIVVDPVTVHNWDHDITVTGQVQQNRGAGWVAAPAGLVVHFDDPRSELDATATVQTGGRFRATFYPGPGDIIARVAGYGQVLETSTRVVGWFSRLHIDFARKDQETNPSYPFRGQKFEVRRTLKAARGEVLPGRKVTLWFAPKGTSYPTTGWKQVGSGVTDANGRVTIRLTA